MRKILILSYHFPPMNVIASQRALGYANHFKKFGYYPTIITHQWEKSLQEQFCEPNDILQKTIKEENENYTVYKMPIGQFKRGKLLKRIEKSFLNKFGILFSWMFGHLDTRGELLNNKLTERYFLKEHLKENQYDVVMGIFSPHYHLSNCAWLYKKYEIPYVLDFRDLWNNRIIHKKYKPNFIEKIEDFFCGFWWKRWAKSGLFTTTVSLPITEKVKSITNKDSFTIMNGYIEESNKKSIHIEKNNLFTITSTGTIYPEQNLDFLLEVFSAFVNVTDGDVIFNFIGMKKKNLNTEKAENNIKTLLPENKVKITRRVSSEEARKHQVSSNLLFFPTTTITDGMTSGKIFEYITSGVNVLAAPIDKYAVSEIIIKTNTGFTSNSKDEIIEFLKIKYSEWKNSGKCVYTPNEMEKNKYSRKYQTNILSDLISQNLN